jgi:hypothetical protein
LAPCAGAASLSRLNFSVGAPVLMLDPNDVNLAGDVTDRFKQLAKAPFWGRGQLLFESPV